MNAFTIKDLENLSGIKAHTIRIWEQRYTFLKPARSETNIRYYQTNELKTILNVALLNKYGFKISQIDKMSPELIREKILTLSNAEAQQERMINSMLHGMIDLNTELFEEVLDDYINAYGIDKTITYLVFPFLHKVGILWLTDHIRIAQEHLVTNVIRQKMIMGIQNASNLQMNPRSVVLYLPEGEHHELGLLYVHYHLKVRGVKVLYLGANVPVGELEFVSKAKQPDYIYTHLISTPARFNFEKYIQSVSAHIPSTPVVISGSIVRNYYGKPPSGIHFKMSLQEVLETLCS